jgi:hypothetical protein
MKQKLQSLPSYMILLPELLSAGMTGMYQHTSLEILVFTVVKAKTFART